MFRQFHSFYSTFLPCYLLIQKRKQRFCAESNIIMWLQTASCFRDHQDPRYPVHQSSWPASRPAGQDHHHPHHSVRGEGAQADPQDQVGGGGHGDIRGRTDRPNQDRQ